jgi:hypothetical protein
MVSSITVSTLLLLAIICSNVKQIDGKPVYSILWNFPTTTSDTIVTTCGETFQTVRDSLYPTFVNEVITETNITVAEVNQLDPDWNTTELSRPSYRNRQLADKTKKQQRQLRSCNWYLCNYDSAYIIRLAGCTTWCKYYGRRLGEQQQQQQQKYQQLRRLDDSEEDSSDDSEQSSSFTGTRTNILWSRPGADTANNVYKAIANLPTSNTCRTSLLQLKYQIKYMDSSNLDCD